MQLDINITTNVNGTGNSQVGTDNNSKTLNNNSNFAKNKTT